MKILKSALILFSLCSFVTIAQVTSITNGLVAEYTFNNGNANADFGGINGTVSNATTADDRFGCPNHAYEFELANESFIDFGDAFNATTSTADSSWSVSMWFKMDNQNNDYEPLFNKYSHADCGVDERQYILRLSANNQLEFTFHTGATWQDFVIARGGTSINDLKWHHVVVNYDGSIDSGGGVDRVSIYLDNVAETMTLAASGGPLGDITVGTAHFGIGARLDETGAYCPIAGQDHIWDGCLDDFRLYNRLLNLNEIDILFNESAACPVSIEENVFVESVDFSLYPNPTSERLNLLINSQFAETEFEVSLYDLTGKKMMTAKESDNHIQLNVEDLSPATYVVWLTHIPSGTSSSLRFVKN